MIIHASKDFSKRFKCEVSGKGHTVLQTGRLDAWSGHLFRLGRTSFVLLMNDALYKALDHDRPSSLLPKLLATVA